MCAVCMSSPCHPQCPNAPEQKPVLRCVECGEGIYEEDKYFESAYGEICEECMDNKSPEEILELFDERFSIA